MMMSISNRLFKEITKLESLQEKEEITRTRIWKMRGSKDSASTQKMLLNKCGESRCTVWYGWYALVLTLVKTLFCSNFYVIFIV